MSNDFLLHALNSYLRGADVSGTADARRREETLSRQNFAAALSLAQSESLQAGVFGDQNGSDGSDPMQDLMAQGLRLEMMVSLSQAFSRDAMFSEALRPGTVDSLIDETPGLESGGEPEPIKDDDFSKLSRMFESGSQGPEAVGYDRVGGTSYGTFQLSSAQGTMDDFLAFLDTKAPEWAGRLRSAGPADTGSTEGGMPDEWRRIASESGPELQALQLEFIQATHVRPVLDALQEKTGLRPKELSQGLGQALFSTAVQHGAAGALRMVDAILESGLGLDLSRDSDASTFIQDLYASRRQAFPSSTARVQRSVLSRLQEEEQLVLASLARSGSSA